MDLATLLRDAPKFHADESGRPHSWQLADEVLELIDDAVHQGSTTLETGAGVSTVLFAIKRSRHFCVVPAAGEVELIRRYCAERDVSTGTITFCVDQSERVLPKLDLPELDLVLIDGAHRFPSPFIDWFYTAARLKVGGALIVDDTNLWTAGILKQFLCEEPEWRLEREIAARTALFVKTQPLTTREWNYQPFVLRNSHPAGSPSHTPAATGLVHRSQLLLRRFTRRIAG